MVQPKTAPISIRVPPAILAVIDAAAVEQGTTRHALILKLLSQGLVSYGRSSEARRAAVSSGLQGAIETLKAPAVPYGSRLKKK